MAILARQTITVPLGGGLETELADKLLPAGKLLELENSFISQTGKVSKRAGYTAISPGGGGVWKMATRKGALVTLQQTQAFGVNPIVVRNEGVANWSGNGRGVSTDLCGPVFTSRLPIYSGTAASVASPDVAYYAPANVYAVVFDGNVGRAMFVDAATGQVVNSFALGFFAGTRPRVISTGTYLFIVWSDGAGTLFAQVWDAATIATGVPLVTTTPVGTLANATDPYIDLISRSGTTVDIAYRKAANTLARSAVTLPGMAIVSSAITTAAAAAIDPGLGLAWLTDPGGSGKLAIATINGAIGVQVQFDITGGTPAFSYVLAGPNIYTNVTGHTISAAASGEFVVLTDEATPLTRFHTRTIVGGIATGVWIRGVFLRSKTFRYNGVDFVITAYGNSVAGGIFQQSYFLMRVSPTHLTTPVRAPLARIMLWQGNGAVEHSSGLTSVVSGSVLAAAGPGLIAALTKVTTLESSGTIFTQDTGVDVVALTFDAVSVGRPAEAIDNLMVPGGSLLTFDGAIYAEEGFPVYPEAPTTPGVETPGGLSAGVYQWKSCFRYTDSNGRVVRSRLGPVLQRTIVGAASRIDVRMSTSRFSSRPSNACVIELWRGVVNDASVFRLVTGVANNPAVDFVTFSDGVSDATLQLAEPAPTTGGVLPNDPVPGSRFVLFFNDRFWMLSDDDRKEAWYSDVVSTGLGLQFSEQRIVRIDDEYGDLTGMAGLGTSAVFFKNEAIYVVNGDGPNSLGQGGFNEAQRVQEGLGCVEPRSIVTATPGVFFKSARGIYLLPSAGGGATYVGQSVARYNAATITGSIHIAKKNQVRFFTSFGTALVYDYLHQQWSVDASDSSLFQGVGAEWKGLAAVYWNTAIYIEDPTGAIYLDLATPYALKLVTPWLSLAGLQGVERFYEIQGVGDSAGAHTLLLSIRYDNDAGPSSTPQTHLFAGAGEWEWRCRPARQLATAIKITLLESSSSAAFSAVALAIALGVEPSHLKRFQTQAKSLL